MLVAVILSLGTAAAVLAEFATLSEADGATQAGFCTVRVAAVVDPTLALTVTTPSADQTVEFGSVDPGTTYGPETVTLIVRSNLACVITKAITGAEPIGLSTSLADTSASPKTADGPLSDQYSLAVPWTTPPGDYTATVQYTAVQK
jgi:hypothetical protein